MDLTLLQTKLNTTVPEIHRKVGDGLNAPIVVKPTGNTLLGQPKQNDPSYTGALRVYADKHKIAKQLVKLAEAGDLKAITYIYDRLEPITKDININNNAGSNSVVEAVEQFRKMMEDKSIHVVKEIEATEVDE